MTGPPERERRPTLAGGTGADVSSGGLETVAEYQNPAEPATEPSNVVPLRPHDPNPKRRMIITTSPVAGEYLVGVDYSSGEYVLCGAFASLAEAMDFALARAEVLGGIAVWDFSGMDGDVPTGTAS